MIGDTSFDMEMGKSAGCQTIGVRWGYHPDDRIENAGADRMANTFDDVIPYVTDLLGHP